MLNEIDQAQLAADRQAFREWWAGEQREPLIVPRREAYCVCDVILPWYADMALSLRYVLMQIIARMPTTWLKVRLYRLMGVRIASNVYIAPGVFIDAFYPSLIEIEDGAFLGIGCRILAHEYTTRGFRAGRVRVGRGSVVGAWSTIRCGVTIGRNVTTGLGSVVVSDVPDGLTVGGVPARPLSSNKDRR